MLEFLAWPILATGFLIGTTIVVTLMVFDTYVRG